MADIAKIALCFVVLIAASVIADKAPEKKPSSYPQITPSQILKAYSEWISDSCTTKTYDGFTDLMTQYNKAQQQQKNNKKSKNEPQITQAQILRDYFKWMSNPCTKKAYDGFTDLMTQYNKAQQQASNKKY